jgi:hypothetical protein
MKVELTEQHQLQKVPQTDQFQVLPTYKDWYLPET